MNDFKIGDKVIIVENHENDDSYFECEPIGTVGIIDKIINHNIGLKYISGPCAKCTYGDPSLGCWHQDFQLQKVQSKMNRNKANQL